MHRFFVTEEIPDEGIFILNSAEIAHQLAKVLKVREGERIALFNGTGRDRILRISKLSSRFVSGRVVETLKNVRDPELEVHLFSSLIKKDNFEWVLEKATELGVKHFHPMISERSVKTGINVERARRIAREATEQSGQDLIPEIYEVIRFKEALELLGKDESAVLFDPSGEERVPPKKSRKIDLFVGPEGGFTEGEREYARERGVFVASFGSRILRAETAAIVAPAYYLTSK